MGAMVHSLLWVMQDSYHQPYEPATPDPAWGYTSVFRFRALGLGVYGLGFRVCLGFRGGGFRGSVIRGRPQAFLHGYSQSPKP